MTLNLDKREKYVNSYFTNWDYLRILTWLLMKRLEEMRYNSQNKYIKTSVGDFPWAFSSKLDALNSMEVFIEVLNKRIMGL